MPNFSLPNEFPGSLLLSLLVIQSVIFLGFGSLVVSKSLGDSRSNFFGKIKGAWIGFFFLAQAVWPLLVFVDLYISPLSFLDIALYSAVAFSLGLIFCYRNFSQMGYGVQLVEYLKQQVSSLMTTIDLSEAEWQASKRLLEEWKIKVQQLEAKLESLTKHEEKDGNDSKVSPQIFFETQSLNSCAMGEAIHSTVEIVNQIAKDNNIPIQVQYSGTIDEFVLLFPEGIIQTMLQNIAMFMVSKLPKEVNSNIEIGMQRLHDRVEITLSDDGPGVQANSVLFEVFNRKTFGKVPPGRSLHPSLQKAVTNAQKIGATIWLESEFGIGTIFHLDIPPLVSEHAATA